MRINKINFTLGLGFDKTVKPKLPLILYYAVCFQIVNKFILERLLTFMYSSSDYLPMIF